MNVCPRRSDNTAEDLATSESDASVTSINTAEAMVAKWVLKSRKAIMKKCEDGALVNDVVIEPIIRLLSHEGVVHDFIKKAFISELPGQGQGTFFRRYVRNVAFVPIFLLHTSLLRISSNSFATKAFTSLLTVYGPELAAVRQGLVSGQHAQSWSSANIAAPSPYDFPYKGVQDLPQPGPDLTAK
jgi:hypothetical protein